MSVTVTPDLDLDLTALEVGDVLTITKDYTTRQMEVFRIDDDAALGPYILVRSGETIIGFDRTTLRYGIVQVTA